MLTFPSRTTKEAIIIVYLNSESPDSRRRMRMAEHEEDGGGETGQWEVDLNWARHTTSDFLLE